MATTSPKPPRAPLSRGARTAPPMTLRRLARAALLLLPLVGCEDQGAPLPSGDPQAPCVCPPGELGSNAACLTTYRNPQICPDLSPVAFCSRYVNTTNFSPIILTNRGFGGLVVNSVSLLGDDNCAFGPPEVSPPLGTVIAAGKQQIIRITYRPQKQLPDYAELRIESNAENFQRLVIPLCGQGIPMNNPPRPDGGVCLPCMMARSSKPACGGAPDGGS